jgi:hypothetical protein
MNKLLLTLFFLPSLAFAQDSGGGVNYGVSVSGAVTPNDCVKFQSPWVIQDAGTTCGGGGGGGTVTSITAGSTNIVITPSPLTTTGTVDLAGTITVGTSVTSPLIIGGTTASSTLTLESTSGSGTTDKIIFDTGSQTQAMQINTGGRVSIGTTSTGSLFNVYGGVSIGTTYVTSAAPTNGLLVQGNVGIGTTSSGTALTVGTIAGSASATGTLTLESTTGAGAGGDSVIIQASGIPVATFQYASNSLPQIVMPTSEPSSYNFGTNVALGYASGNNNYFNGTVAGDNAYRVGSGARMFFGTSASTTPVAFLTAGGVGIGTTTLRNSAVLDVQGTLNVAASTIYFQTLTTSSAGQTGTVCSGTGGLLTVDTTTTCLLSSMRFKKDIESSPYGLAEVMKMQPRTFYYKDDRNGDVNLKRQQIGFIAEEMVNVVPDLVALEKDGKTPKSVAYQNLTAVLVKAVQEQQHEIDDLKGKK